MNKHKARQTFCFCFSFAKLGRRRVSGNWKVKVVAETFSLRSTHGPTTKQPLLNVIQVPFAGDLLFLQQRSIVGCGFSVKRSCIGGLPLKPERINL